jgi:hypothetical protein
MSWRGPSYEGELPTLGYDILEALSDVLPSPADQSVALEFTPEQARLVLRWYAIDPDTGEFIYRRAINEMAKGWGKSPWAASVAIAELALPVRFGGWDAQGEPVAVPWGLGEAPPPWVQVAAVSEDQTENTYAALYEMLTANEGRAASALGIDQGRTRLYLKGRPGRLEPVTASAGSREGQRLTFAILDETHLWTTANKGTKLARTIRRNAAKMGGRTLETTNAPELGEHSVAEASGDEADAGEAGILYYARRPSVEPDPGWTDAQLLAALDECYGDASWIDRRRLVAEVRDPATPWTDALRFYFNVRSVGASRAVDPRRWDELATHAEVIPGSRIGIGFAHSAMAVVLRGCTADGFAFTLGAWPATTQRAAVHEAVAAAFGLYDVGRMLVDPPSWRSEVESWAATYGDDVVLALETAQPRRYAPAVDRWLTALREGAHPHDGDDVTAASVRATHLRKVRVNDPDDDSRTLYVLTPGGSGSIAAAAADVLALDAAATMPQVHDNVVVIEWA